MTDLQLTVQQRGDLALLRQFLGWVDGILRVTGDPSTLRSIEPGTVDTIQMSLIQARYAISNGMSLLGDHSAVASDIPHQIRRDSTQLFSRWDEPK